MRSNYAYVGITHVDAARARQRSPGRAVGRRRRRRRRAELALLALLAAAAARPRDLETSRPARQGGAMDAACRRQGEVRSEYDSHAG